MKVVYGHTDSIYVQIDSVEKAQTAIKEIEASVREHFPNVLDLDEHPVVLEFEKYFSALGVGTTKNRNAGLVSWDDGEWLDEQKFTMTGFTAKRVSETKLAKDVQTTALKMWVQQKSKEEINKYLHDTYVSVLEGKIDIESIIKRARLRSNRLNVKCPECGLKHHIKEPIKWCKKCGTEGKLFVTLENKKPSLGEGIAGMLYAWEHTNVEFDDSYLFLKAKHLHKTYTHPLTGERRNAEYVSGTTYADFKGYVPDWKHYAEQVVEKAKPIYKAMDWDLSSIRTGKIQKKLDDWW
jgi:DNA polymerase elongation subunit (family B)